ncbi:MAG: acyloxyacyl hydrolase [Fimbriimonas sp.]|nr:acyloxyacyl hydrolase [Fimbriimonas sp.]
MKVFAVILSVFALPALGKCDVSDSTNGPSHYVNLFYGQDQLVLGSEDQRYGGGIGYAYGRPEPRFQRGRITGQLIYEIYGDHTQSSGVDGKHSEPTVAVGSLAYARWRWPIDAAGNGVYAELGWGFQLANRSTVDLDSQLNSTPVTGFGGTFKVGKQELTLGLRYLHISNAGLRGHNFGQNELLILAGVRY